MRDRPLERMNRMKKKLVLLLTAVLTISMLAGCGDKGNEVESSEEVAQSNEEKVDISSVPAIKDMDVDKYVTVGNYKEIKVDFGRNGKYEIYSLDAEHDGELIEVKEDLTLTLKVNSCVMIKEI